MKVVNQLSKGKYRNAKCICNSGLKMKNCHGLNYRVSVEEFEEINKLIHENNVKVLTENKLSNKKKEI